MANVTLNQETQINEKVRELGYPAPLPPVSDVVAPNASQWAVPHYLTFSGIVNQISNTYRYTFDEAMLASPANARIMRRDPVLMDALRARQIPTCQLSWHLTCQDETDPQQMYAAANVTQIINEIPRFQWLKMNLLEAVWYGRYGSQLITRWDTSRKYRRLVVKEHRPMNGDKLVFKWSGDVGVLVHPAYGGPVEITDRGLCHFFSPQERQAVLIHHFEPEDSDWYDYEMAGAVEGVGVRSRLYWFWYLKSKMLKYLLDYMQRIGLGIDAFFYEAGNPDSLNEMKLAASSTIGNLRLLLPRNKDGTGPGYQHFEPGVAGAHMFEGFLTNYFDDIMRQYILGQTLTTSTASTGLGSGVAQAHQMTQEMLIQYDATALAETLTQELIPLLYRWNHPGVPYPRFEFDVEKPNAGEYMAAAQMLFEMGMAIDADHLRAVMGLPKPLPGHDIISKFQQGQASTLGVPQGTPVMSQGDDSQQPDEQGDPTAQAQQASQPDLAMPNGGNTPPMIRNSRVHKALDEFLALRHNKNGRRSWSNGVTLPVYTNGAV